MTDERNRLYLRYRAGEAAHKGQLEDYAVYTLALLELYRASFDAAYLEEAVFRADQMVELFEDRDRGGYFITPRDGEQLIARPKEVYDGAIPLREFGGGDGPAGSGRPHRGGALAGGSPQTASLPGRGGGRASHREQLRPAGHSKGPVPPHRELVCAAAEGLPRELEVYLRTKGGEDLSVLVKTAENEAQLARCAPFTASYPVPEQGTVYYLCENGACQAPTRDFDRLPLGNRPCRNS